MNFAAPGSWMHPRDTEVPPRRPRPRPRPRGLRGTLAPARPEEASLGSTQVANATPAGSLAFAQGSTGWTRELMLALALALGGLLLVRTRS